MDEVTQETNNNSGKKFLILFIVLSFLIILGGVLTYFFVLKGGNCGGENCKNLKCENCVKGYNYCEQGTTNGEKYSKCVECNGEVILNGERTMCKEGFKCENYKCVEDELSCKTDEDCAICEGCKNGKEYCNEFNQCEQCNTLDKPCKEGYSCNDGRCMNLEILISKKTCDISDDNCNSPDKCTYFEEIDDSKCVECFMDIMCESGYKCQNYSCVKI